jgi:tetratricopeptide (TPR) repeat protein
MKSMNLFGLLGRRAAVAVSIVLSACAAAPPGGAATSTGNAYGAFLAARYADAQSNPAVATQYYLAALRADPKNQDLVNEGFVAAILAGSPSAVTLAGQVPHNALAVMLRGNVAAVQGHYAQAQAQFAKLPADDLAGLVKPLLVAWAQTGGGNAQAALAGLTPNFSNQLFGPIYVLNAAVIADVSNDMADASQYYAALGGNQPNFRLAQILASWEARQGQMAAAQAVIAKLAAAHPDLAIALPAMQADVKARIIATPTDGMAEAYLTLAGALDQPSQALLRTAFLRFALQLRPDLSAARLLLADQQASTVPGQSAPSAIQVSAALATLQPVPPSDVLFGPVALQRANLLAGANRVPEAMALMNEVIQQNPDNPYPLELAGDILRGNSQYADAAGYYGRALAATPKPLPASAWTLLFDRAICADQQGNWKAAEPDLLAALALAPNQPYILNYLAYSWAVRGEKLDQAAAMLQQATGLDPNDGAVIDSLGYVKLRQNQTGQAMDLLVKAVELSPTDPEVNAHLGDAFHQAGMNLQASYQWQRALALGPDDKLKAQLEQKIKQAAQAG